MSDSIDPRTIEALAEVSASSPERNDNTTKLSSGVVLRHKKVPPMILAKVEERYPDPPVPMIYLPDQERALPNPDDPDYEKALEENRSKKGNAMLDVIVALGTELISVPEGMQKPEDDEWVEEIEFLGLEVPKLKIGRYLAYIRYYAATSAEDFQKLATKGSQALGITEAEVAASIQRFQDNETRGQDTESQAQV